MTTIFYKKLLGRYEITEIDRSRGQDLRIEFEKPIDAKLVIADSVFDVVRGICELNYSLLQDGNIEPKLYTGGSMQTIEGFILSHGAIIRKNPDEEYIRRLADTADSLAQRIERIERSICEIQNKIERKITF